MGQVCNSLLALHGMQRQAFENLSFLRLHLSTGGCGKVQNDAAAGCLLTALMQSYSGTYVPVSKLKACVQ